MANFPALSLPRRSTAGLRTPAVLVVVWLLFGSAFVGLKIGVAAVPPFLFSGSRFLAAGAILLAWCAWRSGWRLELRPADVMAAGLVGLGLMGGGQGAASWAAQELSPGILAVLITTVPLWVALLSWLFLHQRPPLPALAGIATGFLGVVFLASPSGG